MSLKEKTLQILKKFLMLSINIFSTIADKLLSEKKYYGDKHYTDYLSNPLLNSFVFRSCDKIEIELLISELKINKSSGPNGIPIKILHLIKSIISEPLSIIFNNSILTGKYINKLKLSITIPIFKKGSRLLVSDYRPISLLSNLNKIMEKLIFKRVYEFFEKYNCLYDPNLVFVVNIPQFMLLLTLLDVLDQLLMKANMLVVSL